MFFSVIIPVFQDSFRLALCLDGLINQEYPKIEFEVIVVNNDPEQHIQLDSIFFEKLDLKICEEPQPGSYAARNTGISHASGKIIAFTDSDCIPDKDWLKNGKAYFEKDIYREIGILAGAVPLFYQNPKKLSAAEIYEKYTGFTQKQYAKEGNCVTANWFSYKIVVNDFCGFNSTLKSNGDTELSKRISNKYRVLYAPDVIVRHPARYHIRDIAFKYRRLLGGTYNRRFVNQALRFFGYLLNFTFRRVRFLIKKIITVNPKDSFFISLVTWHIMLEAWREYFNLIRGGDTKR